MLPLIISAGRDAVPNIRLNVAKALETLGNKYSSGTTADDVAIKAAILPVLQTLAVDADSDVKFHGTKGLATLTA